MFYNKWLSFFHFVVYFYSYLKKRFVLCTVYFLH